MNDLAQKRQAALEALAAFDDPTAKPPAGVTIGFKVPAEAREAMRALAIETGVNPSAVMRRYLAEWIAEGENGGNGRS